MKKVSYVILTSALLLPISDAVYAAGDVAAGEQKSAPCASCHGADGRGGSSTFIIGGMSVGKFTKGLQAYKSGERKHLMMEMFAKKLSDQDIEDLAAFYATK
jgi:cytochrome c553